MLSANWFEGSGEIMNEARYILEFWKNYTMTHGCLIPLPEEQVSSLRSSLNGKHGIGLCAAIFSLLDTAFQLPHPPLRPESRGRDQAIHEVLYYLNDHFLEKISIADVLRISGLSRSNYYQQLRREHEEDIS